MMDLDMSVMNGMQATKELRDMHVDSLIEGMTSCKKRRRGEIIHGCWKYLKATYY
ncbi:hypothetical protein MTR67_013454 [Solanum verrucosum]|uniref:Uncharacterized protein n=1 Tax=Solanum verrucosum TaxID=315347 RepID=A0AAF0QAG8_SOLVR|nr:hypothetical protein MTR67_013454 [Solanum verrucosum]